VILYRTYVPPPPLDAFIDNLWYWEGSDPGYAKDAILASNSVALLINLRYDELSSFTGDGYADENTLRGIGFSGTHARPFAIKAHQPHMMGMQFKPGGTWPFLKPGGDALHDRHLSLEDVWPRGEAERLHQRLVQAPAPDDKFAILLGAFIARAPRDFALDPAVSTALACFARAPHRASVAGAAKRAEVSHKTLIRLFRETVGMTPKLFLRVTRFQRVIADLHARRTIGWGDVVEQHGYYDQSHFIRDFREFSGFSPTGWLKHRSVAMVSHVPLPD
jgi:AraC-like DNA-binding protein